MHEQRGLAVFLASPAAIAGVQARRNGVALRQQASPERRHQGLEPKQVPPLQARVLIPAKLIKLGHVPLGEVLIALGHAVAKVGQVSPEVDEQRYGSFPQLAAVVKAGGQIPFVTGRRVLSACHRSRGLAQELMRLCRVPVNEHPTGVVKHVVFEAGLGVELGRPRPSRRGSSGSLPRPKGQRHVRLLHVAMKHAAGLPAVARRQRDVCHHAKHEMDESADAGAGGAPKCHPSHRGWEARTHQVVSRRADRLEDDDAGESGDQRVDVAPPLVAQATGAGRLKAIHPERFPVLSEAALVRLQHAGHLQVSRWAASFLRRRGLQWLQGQAPFGIQGHDLCAHDRDGAREHALGGRPGSAAALAEAHVVVSVVW
mmetsp:Transcript_10499/g.27807  ORF Transcript_10499/g.27807 Transcript_10499/m.27807 type:complete len:371 (-) Transcript_10499:439-1551(-)